MTKFRRKPEDPPKPFELLTSDVTDPWGKPHQHADPGEALLTEGDGRRFRHSALAMHNEKRGHEATLTPTQSCAEFFKALDEDFQPGRIISRGRIVGRIGTMSRRWK